MHAKTETAALALTKPRPPTTGRRQLAGNAGGLGIRMATLRRARALRASISMRKWSPSSTVEKARAGDEARAKLLMSYKIGKPLPPNPDEIDRMRSTFSATPST